MNWIELNWIDSLETNRKREEKKHMSAMWKSRHFFDWVSVAATELPLSKPAINKKIIAWNPSPNMELVAALDLMQGPESITEICRLQPAQIDSKVILTRWSNDVKAHLSRMRRRSIGTGTWPCHSRLSLRFANAWHILSPFMTILRQSMIWWYVT